MRLHDIPVHTLLDAHAGMSSQSSRILRLGKSADSHMYDWTQPAESV